MSKVRENMFLMLYCNLEQVLLYDESTAGLDPIASTVLEDLIRSVHCKGEAALGKPGKIASYVVHFQKDIVRGVEGFISISKKLKQIVKWLAEDCCKYGNEKVNAGFPLATAAQQLGTSYNSIEDKRETVLEMLKNQVPEPLTGSIRGAPLEDVRHLARSCDRLRQEVETQATEILRRQTKVRDPTPERGLKLRNMEAKLNELRTSIVAVQKEATRGSHHEV